jgi:hypothetical protein
MKNPLYHEYIALTPIIPEIAIEAPPFLQTHFGKET